MASCPNGFRSTKECIFPNIVNVAVLNGRCTANCIHCPLGKTPAAERIVKFGDGKMDIKLFKSIADQMVSFSHATLRIHSVGEPTLWVPLPDMLEYASGKGVRCWLFTNAITKKKELLKRIVRNTAILEVSVNSIDSKDYKATKGVEAFDRVTENIAFMHQLIIDEGLSTRLLASRVQSQHQDTDEAFVSYWRGTGLVQDAFVRSYHDYNKLLNEQAFVEQSSPEKEVIACSVHWTRFNIAHDGKAVICFNELFHGPKPRQDLVIGDVTTQSIQQIWQGEKLEQIRRAQLEKDYRLVTFSEDLPCKNCRYCQPLDTKRQTSEYQVKMQYPG